MPNRSPASTASDEGALTALTIGIPATAAFLHDLEREPPAHLEDVVRERDAARQDLLPHDLVHGIVAADILSDRDGAPVR